MPDNSSNSQAKASKAGDFVIDSRPQANFRFKEPWTSLALDNLRGFSIQLACAGGSGAIAKTAVAPLERVKVSQAAQKQQMATNACFKIHRMHAWGPLCCPCFTAGTVQSCRSNWHGSSLWPPNCSYTLNCDNCSCIMQCMCLLLQILLQVQQMSSLPPSQRYKGTWDALRRIPQREGGLKVAHIS